jgi:predicted protein tyrosine phosphatase
MLKRKSLLCIVQIHYHIIGQLFKSVSISSVGALQLLMVEIKVGRHLKMRLGTCVHRDYGTPCTNHVLYVILQLMDACTLYKEEGKEKKSFQLLHCWNILRHEPRWHQHMIKLAANKTAQKKHKTVDDTQLPAQGGSEAATCSHGSCSHLPA